jgi:hypothetical protein
MFHLALRISDLLIGQPPGIVSKLPFVVAKEVFVAIDLWPLLRKKVGGNRHRGRFLPGAVDTAQLTKQHSVRERQRLFRHFSEVHAMGSTRGSVLGKPETRDSHRSAPFRAKTARPLLTKTGDGFETEIFGSPPWTRFELSIALTTSP